MPKPKRKIVPKRRRPLARRHHPKEAKPATTALAQPKPVELTPGSKLEQVLIVGDLMQLSPEERIDYYRRMCESLGLNPLTRPFEYVLFKVSEESEGPGKLALYARKDCAEQLRKIHGVSITPPLRRTIDTDRKMVMVEADLRDKYGKTDTATGVVSLRKWNRESKSWGEISNTEYCNAIMKCETKAKRRGTLSICGLAMLDESELDTMTVLGGVSRDGRIYRYDNPIGPPSETPLLEERAHGHKKGSRKADQAEATLAQTEELDRIMTTSTDVPTLMKECGLSKADAEKIAAKNRKKQEPQKAPEPSGPSSPTTPAAEPELEVETVGPDEFIIRGDVTQVYTMIEHYCQFRDGWWRCNLDALKQMQALTNQFKFRINVLPAAGKKDNPAPKPSSRKPASDTAPSGNLVLGVVAEADTGSTSKGGKMLHVKLQVNPTESMKVGVFNEHLFPYLQKGVRVEAYVETKGQYHNISGLKRVKMQNGQVIEFDDDGKTPALSTDREPGTPKR